MLQAPPVDVHLHLLPDVDDGPSNISESIEMLHRFAALGCTKLATTPHLTGALTGAYAEKVEESLRTVRVAAMETGIDVLLGYENMLTADVPARLSAGEAITLAGGPYVLVELPFGFWPEHSAFILFEIQDAGFTPVLAHPERYVVAQADPSRVLELANRGVIVQVTYGSLTGINGRACKSLAEQLLLECPLVILASDAHSNGARLGSIEEGFVHAAGLVGSERAVQMTSTNPEAIVAGEPLPAPEATVLAPAQLSFLDRVRKGFTGE